jgi:replicative DNA helicase
MKKGYDLSPAMLKIPPKDTDIEAAVLGAIMLEKDKVQEVLSVIEDEGYFYDDKHKDVFTAIKRLYSSGRDIDILTVSDELKRTDKLDYIGGNYAIASLTMNVVTAANAVQHAYILKQKFINRELITLGGDLVAKGYKDDDCFENVAFAETKLFNLGVRNIGKGFVTAADAAFQISKQIDDLRNKKVEITGVTSGILTLDQTTGGWQDGDLIILAARPSMGKTSLAMQFGINAAIQNIGVGMFSLEMDVKRLTQRALSNLTGIHLEKINRGNLNDAEMDAFMRGCEQYAQMPIYTDETPALNVSEFKSKARNLVLKKDVKLIIIDYLQLMKIKIDSKNFSREQEVAKISSELKATAKELQVPIIALSQLSRNVESRGDKKPMLSDLRDSGSLEQDADMVIFPFRPEYYGNAEGESITTSEPVVLDIAKHRNGKCTEINMMADLSTQKWWVDAPFTSASFEKPNSPALKAANNYDNDVPF